MLSERKAPMIHLLLLLVLMSGVGTPLMAADEPPLAYVPTVLVTGANRGIGLELARQYTALGWRVIGTARKPGEAIELNALAAASGGKVVVEALDVLDLTAIDGLASKYAGQPVDILFNNAGVTGGGKISNSVKTWNGNSSTRSIAPMWWDR